MIANNEIEVLKRALARERTARKQAEEILEKKSAELYELNKKHKDSKEKVEALLKIKNSELKGVFENIVDPYIMMDLFGNVIKMNAAAEGVLGYKINEDGVLNLMKLTLPEEYEHIANSFQILYNTGRITNFRTKLVTKKNKKILAQVNASIIYDENNKPIAAQGILRDITMQNAAELDLIESEARMSTLLMNLETSVLLENEHDEIVLTNQNFCNLLGIEDDLEDLIGKSYMEVILASGVLKRVSPNFLTETNHTIQNKEQLFEDEVEFANGSIYKRQYVPIIKDNTYKGHLWNFRDITLHRKYQKSLEAERQKYSNIINNMNLGLVEFDLNNDIVFVNQGFMDMSGYSKKELIGKNGVKLLLGAADQKDYVGKRKDGLSDSFEIVVLNKKREKRYWLFSGAPNYNLNGDFIGTIGINYDITNLKALENQKEELLNELEKSNENLQEYAHVVSHDLKSPLRSIDALITWIKEDNQGKLDEMTLQNFDLVEKTLEKMECLISDVLAYSSVGANLELDQNVDIQLLLDDLITILYIPEHIQVQFDTSFPKVMGDRVKLQQVFQNILSNAIKFSDKEQGIVNIAYKEVGDYHQFSVQDNGIGIDKAYFDKIFEIFNSLHKRKDSSGIGLSIVKKIVELHKGKIWLKSELGKGTTFFFTLKK
ncbi:PAS domain-containing sensor histidine kinase [Ochrovirga pacifica]|uniref:PAS domain-containing sensor histidine kinase n=1 Tax=Ochrovirga pacifica TaxID=1042376 RepID=UPI0002559DA7|nr:PAS domain-containing sensor histidine kinase [Ochrovirga pacifica]